MPSECERFWKRDRYAVVGHQGSKKPFPKIAYGALKEQGKTVFAIDPGSGEIEGDKAYPDFTTLPAPVQAAVLELPKEETAAWVAKAADAGVKEIWIHQMTDTPEALAEAEKRGLHGQAADVLEGTLGRGRPLAQAIADADAVVGAAGELHAGHPGHAGLDPVDQVDVAHAILRHAARPAKDLHELGLGGDAHHLAELGAHDPGHLVAIELREVMGIAAEPELVEIFRW